MALGAQVIYTLANSEAFKEVQHVVTEGWGWVPGCQQP